VWQRVDLVYKVLVARSDGNRPLGRPRCRWEYNVKDGFRKVVWRGIDWFEQAQDRNRAGACESGNEPSGPTKLGEFF